jgi:hypothetical protein
MEKLTILVINRPTKVNENIVKDVFNVYGYKYDLLIFPPKENSEECIIQAVSFKSQLRYDFSEIFNRDIDYEDEDDDFYDFDLEEIELDTFYDMLDRRFEVETFDLTDIEKK